MVGETMRNELVKGLCSIFGNDIYQIILYGSVARNEETDGSDIDIAIILTNVLTDEKKEEFLSFAAELDMKYEKVFSIIDIQWENMEKWGNVLPFYKNIKKEGVVLWKAA